MFWSEDLQDRLDECLTMLERGQSLDAYLKSLGPRKDKVRPAIEAAIAIRGVSIARYSDEGFERGRARLLRALAENATPDRHGDFSRPLFTLAGAGLAAVVTFLAVEAGLVGIQPSSSEARVEGVLQAVREGVLVVQTEKGRVEVPFGPETKVPGGAGAGGPAQIAPGGTVRVKIDEAGGGEVSARQVEEVAREVVSTRPEVEVTGTVISISGGDVTVSAPFGSAVIRISARTEKKGLIVPGSSLKVAALREADGSFSANQIEPAGVASGQDGSGLDSAKAGAGMGNAGVSEPEERSKGRDSGHARRDLKTGEGNVAGGDEGEDESKRRDEISRPVGGSIPTEGRPHGMAGPSPREVNPGSSDLAEHRDEAGLADEDRPGSDESDEESGESSH